MVNSVFFSFSQHKHVQLVICLNACLFFSAFYICISLALFGNIHRILEAPGVALVRMFGPVDDAERVANSGSQQHGRQASISSPVPSGYAQPSDRREQFTPVSFGGSQANIGSLGTPNMFRKMRRPSSSTSSRRSTLRSTPACTVSHEQAIDTTNVVLVATRPLLKTLARTCRPHPPWCIGMSVPDTVTEEVRLFSSFLRPTALELYCYEAVVTSVTAMLRELWPTAELHPMSTTAAGLPPLKDMTLHFYAKNTVVTPDAKQYTQMHLQSITNNAGFQLEFCYDYRNVMCLLLTDSRSGLRMNVRYGAEACRVEVASRLFASAVASNEACRQTFLLLDALLRQNKILDDTGTNPEALNSEAVATMLVAIFNSYDANDTPDTGRLLMDFFLTYGFCANFDMFSHSVTARGLREPTSKVHPNAQISVLDPSNEGHNLTYRLEKAAHLQAVFNYCYTAISQFAQVEERQLRAQSVLSTIIGGESYWSRVLQLYHEGISPYFEVVNEKKIFLIRAL
ncbi:hypothetical protein, conserved [Trypanosoma brucei brucei TREU927]|uniref:PAP-associated domain-containing protein n=1 Tax=Trypanosoma brucei brucei (strain 927/4 GUTat10.1) TaxID=185431 RepID=Q585X9_TRYB2|nr:hypothetical protein, conserved [Trypanosoma brucei brucei TREU927]AAX80759.1 hypothetical protein, conserved [Trypanosoma brucei]AAZ11940.1 hypothetical protein, conserved [Trypanosoma brucei brucei TREU927]